MEARYEQGVTLRGQHRDAEALALFRAIYTESHAPRALAQVALAEAALGEWLDAEAHLTEALAAATDPWVRRNRAALEGTRSTIAEHVGSLEVRSTAEGAEVWIHDRRVASLPMTQPVRVIAGTVAFEVRAPGRVTVARVANVAPGGFARESVELAAVAPVASVTTNATATAAVVPRGVVTVAPVVDTPTTSTRASTQRTLGWVAAAGAGAFLVGGTVAYIVGLGRVSEYNETCPPPDTQGLTPACSDQVGAVGTLEALTITGFVGGGVLAATSAVLLLTAPSRRTERAAIRPVCGRGPGDFGVACAVAF